MIILLNFFHEGRNPKLEETQIELEGKIVRVMRKEIKKKKRSSFIERVDIKETEYITKVQHNPFRLLGCKNMTMAKQSLIQIIH